jgi:D-alanyl-D-alanine carboxypeptidase
MEQGLRRFFLLVTYIFAVMVAVMVPSCRFGETASRTEGTETALTGTGLSMAAKDMVQGAFNRLLSDPGLKNATLGFLVLDCTGHIPEVVAEHQPSTALIPASTLKLFVTGAALELIGQPVFSEVEKINQFSINWRASKLLRRIGGEIYGQKSNTNGFRAVLDFWKNKGLDLTGFHLDDGNGLSRNNAISPKQLADLLNVMRSSDYFNVFYSSLPIAGYSGTMKKMLAGTPGEGRVRAKTGTIAGVKSLAGYVNTLSGHSLIFAIIVNNYTCRKKEIRQKFEQVLLSMTEV